MTTIIGVDFSGAQNDNKTWMAKGRLTEGGGLQLDSVQPILRTDLCDLLATVPTPAVAALDFPFGVPSVFVDRLCPGAETMPDVWQAVAGMSLDQYKVKCRNFGKHPKRMGDKHYPVSISALNTRLVPMTYYGTKMLLQLRTGASSRYLVPPLDSDRTSHGKVTLLEVMPGALLRSIGVEYDIVKGFKNAANALDNRDIVINRLSDFAKSEFKMTNLLDFRLGFRANDDCLDAAVAAVAAALWTKCPSRLKHPSDKERATAQLEGWIYAPR